jgi:hypothetical protein
MKRAILTGALLLGLGFSLGSAAGGAASSVVAQGQGRPQAVSPMTNNQIEWFQASDVGLEGIKEQLIYVNQSSVGCEDCYSYLVPGDNLETGEAGYLLFYGIPFQAESAQPGK